MALVVLLIVLLIPWCSVSIWRLDKVPEVPYFELAKLILALLKAVLEFSSLIKEGGMFSFGLKPVDTEVDASYIITFDSSIV